jgi:hypothetical protein
MGIFEHGSEVLQAGKVARCQIIGGEPSCVADGIAIGTVVAQLSTSQG